MDNPLLISVACWAGLVVLFILCLPAARISKFILEVFTFVLRLALLATLVGGAYLWFRPELVPVETVETVQSFPAWLQEALPRPGTAPFGPALAAVLVLLYLPALALGDVGRQLAGRRLVLLRRWTDGVPAAAEPGRVAGPNGEPARPRGSNLNSAADAMASAPRKPHRVSDYVR